MTQDKTRVSGTLEMIAAMTLSGTLGFFVFESGQSPYNVVFFRCLFGALCLFTYCAARGMLKPNPFTARLLALALVGGAAIVGNWVLLFSSYSMASISIATSVYHLQPFFLLIIGAMVFQERISANKIAWICLAFVGLILVVQLNLSELTLSSRYFEGLLLALGAALLYAIATMITKRLKGIRPHVIALVQVTLGVFLLLPFANLSATPELPKQWACLVALGAIHTMLMYILMYSAFQKLPTPAIAVLSFIYPGVAIIVDYVFYSQHLAKAQFLGIAFILIGNLGVNLNWTLPRRLVRGNAMPTPR